MRRLADREVTRAAGADVNGRDAFAAGRAGCTTEARDLDRRTVVDGSNMLERSIAKCCCTRQLAAVPCWMQQAHACVGLAPAARGTRGGVSSRRGAPRTQETLTLRMPPSYNYLQ